MAKTQQLDSTPPPMAKMLQENFEAFKARTNYLSRSYDRKYALMHNRKLQNVFTTLGDAVLAGNLAFGEGTFSVQEITDAPIDLGYFSHVEPL